MAITLTAQSGEPLPTGEYRVELTAIELSSGQYGEQLKWTFSVPDKGRNLVAYSTFSPSLASKCMRWAGALLDAPYRRANRWTSRHSSGRPPSLWCYASARKTAQNTTP
jgi:hypothetical protein